MIYYLLAIGIVDTAIFAYDKSCARNGCRRIPEKVLHLLELLGGVFLIVPMMYVLRHKNKKISYFAVTYALLLVWLAALYAIYFYMPTH